MFKVSIWYCFEDFVFVYREIFRGEMVSLQGLVICPAVQAKQNGVCTLPVNGPLLKAKFLKSGFWGCKGIKGARINVNHQLLGRQYKKVQCCYSSSSNDNGSMAENFSENDEDYVNSSVVEAGTICEVGLIINFLGFHY